MSINVKMTALADEVRALSGGTIKVGIDDMTADLNTANNEIDSQIDIIALIKSTAESLPNNTDADEKWLLRENTSYTNNSATSVGYGALCYHQKLESINLPNVTTIEVMGCSYCPKLTEINLPKLVSTSNYAFRDCTALVSVYLPEATTIPYAFVKCTALTSVNIPKLKQTRGSFNGCTALTSIELPESCTKIDIGSFQGCTNLTSVIINSPTVANLVDVNAFTNTPIASGTGYIYVTDNLVATYKNTKIELSNMTVVNNGIITFMSVGWGYTEDPFFSQRYPDICRRIDAFFNSDGYPKWEE